MTPAHPIQTILVVEDHDANHTGFEKILSADGYRAALLTNGQECRIRFGLKHRGVKKIHLILDKAVVGHLVLYADALQTGEDFSSNPPRSLTFKQAREVACRVAEGGTWGYIERYRWELQSGPG